MFTSLEINLKNVLQDLLKQYSVFWACVRSVIYSIFKSQKGVDAALSDKTYPKQYNNNNSEETVVSIGKCQSVNGCKYYECWQF